MMMNKKKIAALIVRGLADFDQDKAERHMEDTQGVKTTKENAESDDSRLGVEVAMRKFIDAVHDRDTKKAIEAMCEFQEMSSGMEYYESSTHESDEGE